MGLGTIVSGGPVRLDTSQVQFIGPEVKSGSELNIGEDLVLAGEAGTAGQVLTSQGEGNPPIWADGSGGGSAEWGDITGTLSDQTDLQTALDEKAPVIAPTFTNFAGVYAEAGSPTSMQAFSSTNTPTLASSLYVARSRYNSGTLDVPQAGDSLGFFSGVGFDGTTYNFSNPAGMEVRATENFSPTNLGSEIRFNVIGTGTATNFGLMQGGHNGTYRYLNLGTSAGGVRLTYNGSSTNNRPVFQATSGTGTAVIFKPPGSTSSDNAAIRLDSSSSASTFDFLSLAATGTAGSKYRLVLGTVTAGVPSDGTEDLLIRGGGTGTVYGSIGPVDGIKSDVAMKPPAATLATLPDATVLGRILFVSDANSGVGTICFSNGTDWIDVKTGVAVV